MNNEILVLDARKAEKRNILLGYFVFFLYVAYSLLNKESTDGFFLILIFVIIPAIRFIEIKCPKCNMDFFKRVYFAFSIMKEKRRTQCCHCKCEPHIYSDFLETDSLSKDFPADLIDLRSTEKNILMDFFVAGLFVFISGLIIFMIIQKTSFIRFSDEILLVLFLFLITGCFLSISKSYRRTRCPNCKANFFKGYFGFIKARKMIKQSTCQSCKEHTFIRSYLVVANPRLN